MPAPRRVLRVGVVVGTTLVEERLVRGREPVGIGDWVALRAERGGYTLRLAPGMHGRIAEGAQIRILEAGTEHREVPLSDQARGKVCLGDTAVLFQFVNEPPAQPRPTLPASVRGTFADRIDRRLAAIVAASLVVHFGLALAAWMHDRPVDRTRGAQAENMRPDTFEVPDPEWFEQDTVPADADDPGASTQPTTEPTPSTTPSTPRPRVDRPVETDAASLQEEAARYAAALAAAGESDDGIGEMDDTAPGGDLAKQMKEAQASNAKVELGGNGERGPRDDGAPRDGTADEPVIGGPDGPKKTQKTETSPKARIDLSRPKGFDETTLSPESVRKRILEVYMTGLQRCQRDLLLDDPTARARVDLSFTVNASGRTTSPDARSELAKLDRCIEQRMAGWTFPAPEDEDGEKTEASFGITLALQPE